MQSIIFDFIDGAQSSCGVPNRVEHHVVVGENQIVVAVSIQVSDFHLIGLSRDLRESQVFSRESAANVVVFIETHFIGVAGFLRHNEQVGETIVIEVSFVDGTNSIFDIDQSSSRFQTVAGVVVLQNIDVSIFVSHQHIHFVVAVVVDVHQIQNLAL